MPATKIYSQKGNKMEPEIFPNLGSKHVEKLREVFEAYAKEFRIEDIEDDIIRCMALEIERKFEENNLVS